MAAGRPARRATPAARAARSRSAAPPGTPPPPPTPPAAVASGGASSGGDVTITAGGAVTLSQQINTTDFGGGKGTRAGTVTINALGNVALGTGLIGQINSPAISSWTNGSGADGAVNIVGASILL